MTFLQKLGSVLKIGLQLAGVVMPTVQAVAPDNKIVQTVSNDLDQIGSTIGLVEAIGQALSLPGAQKLQAASGPVSQIILQSSLMAGRKIAQPELFTAGATKVASGMADILNSLHENGLVTVNKT